MVAKWWIKWCAPGGTAGQVRHVGVLVALGSALSDMSD